MKRAGRFLLTALYAILLHLVLLSLILLLTVFRTGFLERENEAYGVAQKLGMSAAELHDVTEQMMRYVIRGEEIPKEQEFFNGRELEHLADIRQMMVVWHFLLGMGMLLLAAMSAFYIRRGGIRRICKGYLYSWLWIAAAGICLAVIAMTRLNAFVNGLHRFFFRNNRWILNPATDRLIWLFPAGLFRDGLFLVLGVGAAVHLTLMAGALLLLKRRGGSVDILEEKE